MAFVTLHSPEEWVARFGNTQEASVVAIGNFDGVHLGHQRILRSVLERAQRNHLRGAVLTFYPHPAQILRPAEAPPLLMTLNQRLAAFEAMGIDAALVMQFNEGLSQVSAEDFVRRFLVEAMRARAVLIGKQFRFGQGRKGDANLMAELGKQYGFEVEIVPLVSEEGEAVSSTAIRNAVREGRMEDAQRMLGKPFALAGEIQTGTGQGRKLVVPTLNLKIGQQILPKNGVYATESIVAGKTYRSATNVGMRPTFDGARLTIESHLFEFSETLTAGPMEVRFWTRLRDEQKFSGPEALREQVLKDIERAKEYFLGKWPTVKN